MTHLPNAGPRRDLYCMLGLLGAFLLWNFFFGETILIGDGLGVDGIEYARITREVPEVLDHGLGPLYAGRVVPPLVVRLLIETTGLGLDNAGVIAGFKIYNGILMLASVLLWHLIARQVRVSSAGRWLGFLFVFGNCAQLEFHLYYPVLTDVSALFLSLALLYCHLRDLRWAVFLLAFVGAFTWPTLLYLGLVLFLFPHRREPVAAARPLFPNLVGAVSALGAVAGLAYGAVTGYREGLTGEWAEPGLWGYALLAFGCALVALYAFFVGRILSDQRRFFEEPWSCLASGFFLRLALAAGLYLSVGYLSDLFLAEHEALRGQFLVGSLMRASQRPLIFYVQHVLYFGPLVIVAAYHWRRIVQLVHSHGLGLTLYAALSAVLSIQPLTRQSLTTLPLLALFVALALEGEERPSRRELWGLAGLSLLISRVWMPVNALQARWPIGDDSIFWFRINYGKFFSDLVYVPELVFVALLTVGVIFHLRRRERSPEPAELPPAARVESEGIGNRFRRCPWGSGGESR